MPHTPKTLPDQWTILLHTVHNLTILTLLDADGGSRQIGFAHLPPPGAADRTVTALKEITEPALRDHAQQLIDTFYERTATAQANVAAFSAAVPDVDQLLDRLRRTAPSGETSLIRTGLTVDDDKLTPVLTLTATGPAAATLFTLALQWPRPTAPPAEGFSQDLDTHGNLTLRLDQTHAEQFLTWYRAQP
ncbi:hypothetical protein LRE75_33065 [Streptomyces sp. 372A]